MHQFLSYVCFIKLFDYKKHTHTFTKSCWAELNSSDSNQIKWCYNFFICVCAMSYEILINKNEPDGDGALTNKSILINRCCKLACSFDYLIKKINFIFSSSILYCGWRHSSKTCAGTRHTKVKPKKTVTKFINTYCVYCIVFDLPFATYSTQFDGCLRAAPMVMMVLLPPKTRQAVNNHRRSSIIKIWVSAWPSLFMVFYHTLPSIDRLLQQQ